MNFIVAMNESGVIGKDNKLPWHLPEDLERFKTLTTNHIIVMGRRTFDSLPKKPLPNRIHVVITKDLTKCLLNYPNANNVFFVTFENVFMLLFELKSDNENKEVFVIGGSDIFRLLFDSCKTMYITTLYTHVDEPCIRFPFSMQTIDRFFNKEELSYVETSNKSGIKYQFITYTRK